MRAVFSRYVIIVAFTFLLTLPAYAADFYRSDPNNPVQITDYDPPGYTINNIGPFSYFIPTRTRAEFDSFRNAIPRLTGLSICVPNCAGKNCGSDGCGGTCGSCPDAMLHTCNAAGQCVCKDRCSNVYKYCYAHDVNNYPLCNMLAPSGYYEYTTGCSSPPLPNGQQCCSSDPDCPAGEYSNPIYGQPRCKEPELISVVKDKTVEKYLCMSHTATPFCTLKNVTSEETVQSCSQGQVCYNTQCCTKATCASLGKSCGSWPNGCGGTLNCGSCSAGQECISGTCLSGCRLPSGKYVKSGQTIYGEGQIYCGNGYFVDRAIGYASCTNGKWNFRMAYEGGGCVGLVFRYEYNLPYTYAWDTTGEYGGYSANTAGGVLGPRVIYCSMKRVVTERRECWSDGSPSPICGYYSCPDGFLSRIDVNGINCQSSYACGRPFCVSATTTQIIP